MLSHSIDVFFINYKNTISQRATWLIGSKATLHLTLYHSITCASYFISLDLNGLNMFKLFKSTGFHIHDYREEQLYPEILLFRFPSDFYSAIGARHTSLLALFDVSSASNSADLCILFQDLSTSFVPTDKPLEWLRSFLLECIDCVTFDSPRLAQVHALLVSPKALFLDFFCTLSTRQIGALLVCLTNYMRMTCRYTLTVMWLQYGICARLWMPCLTSNRLLNPAKTEFIWTGGHRWLASIDRCLVAETVCDHGDHLWPITVTYWQTLTCRWLSYLCNLLDHLVILLCWVTKILVHGRKLICLMV